MKPLTPPDCDLRNFPFMPLDVLRLRDSDLSALESAEAFRAAVLLWCASWHQVPAASLPKDDHVLSNLAGFGRVVKEWQKVKKGALRGWVECDDGRLYHPVIAEKALDALEGKYKQLWRTEIGRIRKHNQRHQQDQLTEPTFNEFMSYRTNNNCPIGQHANVPDASHEKPHPIERERERERDITVISNIEGISNLPSVENQNPPTLVGEICKALVSIQLPPFNQSNPKFLKLVEAGAGVAEFYNTAQEIKSKDPSKFNFDYLIGTMTKRRQSASGLDLIKGALPAKASREAGRNIAAKSIFTPENTRHLQGNINQTTEIEVFNE